MFRRLWQGPERRRFERHEAALDVQIEVEIYGFEGESRPFFASGTTVNVSRSGALARLDVPIARGSVCKLFFRRAEDKVRPHHVAGRVVRMVEHDGLFEVAVQFDAPLARLEVAEAVTSSASA